MSWLRSGLSQSITGGITSLKGQLEDILTEGTEEIEDPQAEVRAGNEKLKEYERQLELVRRECARWQEEANEMGVKCQTYEAQLAQRHEEYRRLMADKEVSATYYLLQGVGVPCLEFFSLCWVQLEFN